MKAILTSSKVSRRYMEDGSVSETIESEVYKIVDKDGNTVGGATVEPSYFDAHFNDSQLEGIDESRARFLSLFDDSAVEPESES